MRKPGKNAGLLTFRFEVAMCPRGPQGCHIVNFFEDRRMLNTDSFTYEELEHALNFVRYCLEPFRLPTEIVGVYQDQVATQLKNISEGREINDNGRAEEYADFFGKWLHV